MFHDPYARRPRLLLALVVGHALLSHDTRAAVPAKCFVIDVLNDTVYDGRTQLTWQRTVSGTTYDWAGAKAYCIARGSGWRLPSYTELFTIGDETRPSTGYIDPLVFPGTPNGSYWSSTVYAGPGGKAWLVDSLTSGLSKVVATMAYARCVR